ncbi:MAG: zinc ribbon domain-containing protein, partial [Acidobacteriia bacterium]|nr:zinc ribbon domain-containing protein [Terriglobia bacterium]
MFCAACGSPISTGAQFCASCGAPVTAPAAPSPGVTPSGPIPAVAAPAAPAVTPGVVTGPKLAGLGRRVIALIFDTLLLVIAFGVAGMWAADLLKGWKGELEVTPLDGEGTYRWLAEFSAWSQALRARD